MGTYGNVIIAVVVIALGITVITKVGAMLMKVVSLAIMLLVVWFVLPAHTRAELNPFVHKIGGITTTVGHKVSKYKSDV